MEKRHGMKLDEHIALWSYAGLKILDLRHSFMGEGERKEGVPLPANGFIVGVRGAATLDLNGKIHTIGSSYVLHGCKGMSLDIWANEQFEYYLLLYRASLPGYIAKTLGKLADPHNPLAMSYGFRPDEPLALLRVMDQMEQAWMQGDALGKIRAKSEFYRFVHDVLLQYRGQLANRQMPDSVSQAVSYLHEHYRDNIALDDLAERLNYSPRHLSMRFKDRMGVSPIEYLIGIRIEHAAGLLLNTDAGLREIAVEVGYADVYYFSRLFKNRMGVSPVKFRSEFSGGQASDNRPFRISESSIGGRRLQGYDFNGNENRYQYLRGGSTKMPRNPKAGLAVSLLLSLTLILGAGDPNDLYGQGRCRHSGRAEAGRRPLLSGRCRIAWREARRHLRGVRWGGVRQ